MPTRSDEIEVRDLVKNFHFALKALGKSLIRVGIDLSDSYSGDAWDDSAENLYQYLIVEPIVTSNLAGKYKGIVLPQYEMTEFDYGRGAFLECGSQGAKKQTEKFKYAFFGFLRRSGRFDKVRCCKLDSAFKICGEEIFLWRDLSFQLVLPNKNGKRPVVRSITLQE